MMEYRSKRTDVRMINGTRQMITKIIDISGNKGTKRVIKRGSTGRAKTSKKSLTKKEISCIKRCQFIPGLFHDCEAYI